MYAFHWVLSSQLAERLTDQEVRKKVPAIESPDDLQNLLGDLVTRYPLTDLQATFNGQEWVVDGQLVDYVVSIEIAVKTQTLRKALAKTQAGFVGLLDLVQTQNSIVESFKRDLADKGYYAPTFKLTKTKLTKGVNYLFDIEVGPLCRVKRVHYSFKRLKDEEDIIKGEVCSESTVQSKVEQLEEQAKALGYRTAKIRLEELKLADNKESAEVMISGDLGERVIFSLVEKKALFKISDIFKDDDFEGIDPYITDPKLMSDEITRHFVNEGFLNVKLEKARLIERKGTKEYRFIADKGPQFMIRNIIIDGNKVFSSTQLIELIELTTAWQTDIPLKRENIVKAIERVKGLYEQQGYWDVRISYPVINKDQASAQVELIFFIKEGKQRILDEFEFTGNTFFTQDQLHQFYDLNFGDPVSKGALRGLEDTLLEAYLRNGFNYCNISVAASSAIGKRNLPTTIKVKISEGVRVKIGDIFIKGLTFTHEKVIRRELSFAKGDWYEPEHISESRRALLGLGLFRSVQISPRDQLAVSKHGETIDIVVEVSEGNHGTLSFGPGFSFQKGFQYSSEIGYNNIGGEGRKVSLRGAISQERDQESIANPGDQKGKVFLGRKVTLGYIEPYFLGTSLDGKMAVSHLAVADTIWKISNTFNASVTYKFKRQFEGISLSPYYNYKLSKDVGSLLQYESLVSTGPSRIGRVGLETRIDMRDNLAWPEKGYFARLDLADARPYFGGSFNFFRWEVYFKQFFRIMHNLVFDYSVWFTAYERVTSTDHGQAEVLPSSERLLAGGPNRVKGFQKQLGPYVRTESSPEVLGATRRNILSLELRQRFSPSFGASLFIDSGNSFFSADELSKYNDRFSKESGSKKTVEDNFPYGTSDLEKRPDYFWKQHYNSYGAGFNLITPIGPLNLFLSCPISEPISQKCKNEGVCYERGRSEDIWYKRYQLDMSIGSEF